MRPNFFILGAPKCGTTSLASWLAEHPNLFMCPVKEPRYFNTDHHKTGMWSRRRYEWLFRSATAAHVGVGEASVWYLFSEVAVENILRYSPRAKFIVCVRNPIEMAPSVHEQQVFAGNEHIRDFRRAWHLQAERMAGRAITRWCSVPMQLAYGHVCSLGGQLDRLYRQVERYRVHTVVLDDMAIEPRHEYRRVLSFLGVADDGRLEFPRLNEAKERRSPVLRRALQFANMTKTRMGIPPLNTRTGRWLNNINRRPRRRQPLEPAMHDELVAYFEPEVRRLADLLGRDMTVWL